MCNAIYLAAIGLLLFYVDYVVGQYGLAVADGQAAPMVVAVGWETVWMLWPLVVLGSVLGSAVTLMVMRRRRSCATGSCS